MYLQFDFDLNTFLQKLLNLRYKFGTKLCTFVKWAVIYCTGLVAFRWSHILTSPSCAVAKVCDNSGFQRTWDDPAIEKIKKWFFFFLIKKESSSNIFSTIYLPTADRDKHGFLWSLISQICINVSILQEAMISGSLGCQFKSLTTRVCAFRLCIVCSSYPPAPLKFNISIRVLL